MIGEQQQQQQQQQQLTGDGKGAKQGCRKCMAWKEKGVKLILAGV